MASPVAFYLLAALILIAAGAVVTLRNVLHAGLCLIVCFWGVAGMYVLLDAPFLAAIQILIYVGAISVLLIFAIMLTQRISTRERPVTAGTILRGLVVGIGFAAMGGYATFNTEYAKFTPVPHPGSLLDLATNFLTPEQYLVPFEVVAVLLLVAMVGAVIIARKDEPSAGTPLVRTAPAQPLVVTTVPTRIEPAPPIPVASTPPTIAVAEAPKAAAPAPVATEEKPEASADKPSIEVAPATPEEAPDAEGADAAPKKRTRKKKTTSEGGPQA
ncbi:MAG: NADH-quinone oxidoreductase subunit J family protein [Candidatus Xenobia bacterium]